MRKAQRGAGLDPLRSRPADGLRKALAARGEGGELVARLLDVAAGREALSAAWAALPGRERLQLVRFLLTPSRLAGA